MKIGARTRLGSGRRNGWQVLEAQGTQSGDSTHKRGSTHPLRGRAWHVLEAPTGEQPAVDSEAMVGPALPDESTVHFVLELALRIGEVQMLSGAGASDVTATIIAITKAFGLPHTEVDVIFTSITATCHRGSDESPVTSVRVVRGRSLDYNRLSETERLVQRITRGRVSPEQAYSELQRINTAAHPYPRIVSTLAWGGMAGFITLIVGGSFTTALFAFLISAVVDRVGRFLNHYSLPFFFQQVMGGLIATLSATAVVNIEVVPVDKPSLVAAGAITVLLSGLGTVSAVQDAITGYNVTAAGRTMEVVLMSAGLITGVTVGLRIAELFEPQRQLQQASAQTVLDLPIMLAAGGGAAACFALASYARLRSILVGSVAGAVGAVTYGALNLLTASPLEEAAGRVSQAAANPGLLTGDLILSSAVAATLVGFAGGVMARRLKVTPLVVAVSGITPLLPGLATYRGLYALVQGQGVTALMAAAAIGLALAAGVVLGKYLAQPVRTGLGKLERKLAGPRMAGPLDPLRRTG